MFSLFLRALGHKPYLPRIVEAGSTKMEHIMIDYGSSGIAVEIKGLQNALMLSSLFERSQKHLRYCI